MRTLAIRWLGAFRKEHNSSLEDSLRWELTQSYREVAAEMLDPSSSADSNIDHAQVGLRVCKGSIVRRYWGDVWSETKGSRLVATRSAEGNEHHTECFCKPRFDAIVVKRPLDQFRPIVRRAIVSIAREFNLPVMQLIPSVFIPNEGWSKWQFKRINLNH